MGTAFAAAARTLFTDPNGSVAGVCTVGGAGRACRVLFAQHDPDVLAFDGPGASNPGQTAEVLTADLPIAPTAGVDTLTVNGRTYGIRSVRQPNDPDGLTWMLDLGPQE